MPRGCRYRTRAISCGPAAGLIRGRVVPIQAMAGTGATRGQCNGDEATIHDATVASRGDPRRFGMAVGHLWSCRRQRVGIRRVAVPRLTERLLWSVADHRCDRRGYHRRHRGVASCRPLASFTDTALTPRFRRTARDVERPQERGDADCIRVATERRGCSTGGPSPSLGTTHPGSRSDHRNSGDGALAFYRQLGLDIPTEADCEGHVEFSTPEGLRLAWDTIEVIRSFSTWEQPEGSHRIGLAFLCDNPAEVDAHHGGLVQAGYRSHLEPFDAFLGAALRGRSSIRTTTRSTCSHLSLRGARP